MAFLTAMLGRMANQHLSYLVQVMLGCTLVQCGAGKIEWMFSLGV